MTRPAIAHAAAAISEQPARDRVIEGLRDYGLHGAVVLSNPTSGRIGPLPTTVVIGQDETGARLCLKFYGKEEKGRSDLRAHARYLQALRGHVPVPEVVGLEETAERFGRPALVTSDLGEPFDYAIDSLSAAARRQVMEGLADTMATLAELSLTEIGLPAVSPEETRAETAASFASSAAWYSENTPEDVERGALVLRGAELLRGAEVPRREAHLCHRDLAMCNVMVRKERFSGLIDWDYAGPAPAARDLGSAVAGVLAAVPAPRPQRLELLAGLLARYQAKVGEEQSAQGYSLALACALESLLDWLIGDKNGAREDLVWATSLVMRGLSESPLW
jgi:aminoglycoside phosphotransferase (APT) family kinase protein